MTGDGDEYDRIELRVRAWARNSPYVHAGIINLDDPLALRSLVRLIQMVKP